MLDQRELDWFVAMNRGLHDALTTDGLADRLRDNVALMDRLAAAIGRHASADCPGLDARAAGGDAASIAPALFARAACDSKPSRGTAPNDSARDATRWRRGKHPRSRLPMTAALARRSRHRGDCPWTRASFRSLSRPHS
jgi:hypothetical protein